MPVYDYKCEDHGIFHELATLEDHQKPIACPTCGKLSARVIIMSPSILDMAAEKRHAHETNERASHEPVFSNKDRRENDHEHSKGCGCQGGKKSKLIYTAQGDKMFPSMRPWMISH